MSSYRRATATRRREASHPVNTATPKNGVLYLRVSSVKQTHTAADVSADGNSIATQREECDRKAVDLGVAVQKVFIEPGRSAQTIDKRPEFRLLLAYLAEHPEVDYVIVYSRSRAFRNIEDAILTRRHLRGLGVKIISTKEDFGDTLESEFMETITDSMNDLQNRRNGEDIKMKMAHKARNGGTIGRAPIGYLNVRKEIDGRQINSVAIDEQRAPLIRTIFELYATGEYTLNDLAEAAEDLGLRARPVGRWKAERPLTTNSIHRVLGDPYYAGHTVYQGELFDGRHPRLITQTLFDRVQDVLDVRSSPAVHDQKLTHYLKGLLFCDRCNRAGRRSRLIYTEVTGNGGRYMYFKCRSVHTGDCDLPHLPADLVAQKIVEHYERIRLTPQYLDELRSSLESTIADQRSSERDLSAHLTKELNKLTEQEERLLDAVQDNLMPRERIHARLAALHLKRASVAERLSGAQQELDVGAELLRGALDLSQNPHELYQRATDLGRSHLNHAFFTALYFDEHSTVADSDLAEPFTTLDVIHQSWLTIEAESTTPEAPAKAKERSRFTEALLASSSLTRGNLDDYSVAGLNSLLMVGVVGIEPTTKWL